ncbi:signal transduction histidine kinase [Stackebrandtia albiflava]|uniref:histidine kinase n=1 Tax=Stackebrandtia albiflava TaxID=406432 RepID=A0A562V0V9_9ACTN|nr:histidine kinase [Stackebrandtia albiflava]TWJ11443.1 signal transduction histidine kinase [Stackebrandtia albiflava]
MTSPPRTGWPRRLRGIGRAVLDVALGIGAGVVLWGISSVAGVEGRPLLPAGLAWFAVLATAVGASVAVRRRWPLAALVVTTVAMLLFTLSGATREPYTFTALVMYEVAARRPPARSALALTGVVAAAGTTITVVYLPTDGWYGTVGLLISIVVLNLGGWLLGQVKRLHDVAVSRDEAERRRQAVTVERLRIARELHDVVAHSMSVIAVKAGVTALVAESDPPEAARALRVIEDTSRKALVEMRHMLGVLRDGSDDATEGALLPAPRLTDLRELVDRAAVAGVAVDLSATVAEPLPEGVELAVYRIVQEAVTNVIKHAGVPECRVVVAMDGGEVVVTVSDSGRGGEPGGRGHGITGMRERVAVYGGEVSAGPGPSGGFTVAARIPAGEAE